MSSPCTKVCVMDADNRYCLGCKRTLGEIARWGEMNDAERSAVLAQLPARRSAAPSDIAEVSAPPLA
ncbi:MAG TPA: DUF1289 domain-containing protein [Burkholderiales bacterium]|nr:DUF1289 domain-containing protein [Burkholderiales bacterium]